MTAMGTMTGMSIATTAGTGARQSHLPAARRRRASRRHVTTGTTETTPPTMLTNMGMYHAMTAVPAMEAWTA